MAVCLEYQRVYYRKAELFGSLKWRMLASIALVATLAWKVFLTIESTNLGYDLAKERNLETSYEMEKSEKELELSVISKRESILKLSNQKLGLLPLKPGQARRVLER